jgi:uncharacterized protein YjbI with pentapeptide repeats
MQIKFFTRLQLSLLLSVGLSLGMATLISAANTRNSLNSATLNGISLNGANLNGTSFNGANLNGANLNGVVLNGLGLNGSQLVGSTLTTQLQLEGSQLVLHLD